MAVTNETLAKIELNEPTYGAWVSSMSPRSAEVMGANGMDWAVVDMEHTPIGARGAEQVIRGIECHGMTPLIRLPELDYGLRGACKRALDSGGQGLIVPRVESREEAEQVAEAALFPPEGERGVAGSVRANYYGTRFDDYVEAANDEVLLMVQIETATGADRADDILSVPGVDGVFIGENDLSTTHRAPGQKDVKSVQDDVNRIVAAAEDHDAVTGIVAPVPERIERRVDEGFDLVSVGSDLYFMNRSLSQLLPK
jgi:2-dehydro-3-deoxyglucarate aldolase/4-hydroxy-2-oxoheptanedioate aldolase